MKNTVYNKLATHFNAYNNCLKHEQVTGTTYEWTGIHEQKIKDIIKKYMPSGSGIDNGIKFNMEKSTDDKLVFDSSCHVMNDNGYYIGWVDFTFSVKPSFIHEIVIDFKGNFSDYKEQEEVIKDYLYETIRYALVQEIE